MKKALLLLSLITGIIVAAFLLWPQLGIAPTTRTRSGFDGDTSPEYASKFEKRAPDIVGLDASGTATGPMSDEDWKKVLTAEQFYIIRKEGTEAPFSSPLDHETRPGTYVSADCGVPLFRSEQKYDSGTGWPSFWAPISPDVLTLKASDSILLGERIEVRDAKCDGHLGHVFDDGPPPTGKRYCMNGLALRFIPD